MLCLLFAVMLHNAMCCNQKDHSALLNFKHSIIDPSSIFSSWSHHQDCCEWPGVECSNITGRLSSLSLPCDTEHSGYGSQEDKSHCLTGELNLSFFQFEFLTHLDLSYNDFKAFHYDSSSCANSSSNLHYLDFSYNNHLKIDNLQWLSCFSSLKYVSFSGIDLHRETNWLKLATMLPLLSELYLSSCKLRNISSTLQYANFSSLQVLDLSLNDFGSVLLPNWLFNLSVDFSSIYLSGNSFQGQLPEGLLNLGKLHSLRLNGNKLSGPIPNWLGKLEHLQYLDVGGSPGLIFEFDSLWIPPFQLLDLSLEYVSPKLPAWLYTQTSLETLWIYNSTISFEPQDKFWNLAAQATTFLGLLYNTIDGDISNVLLNSTMIFLGSNNFKGSLPRLSANVVILFMRNNSITGSISSLLCQKVNGKSQLEYLEISDHYGLSGGLSDCWMNWKSLVVVKLGNNNLTGTIPTSFGFLSNLKSLHLNDNNLFGEIPQSLQNCHNLKFLHLGQNQLSGKIPNWIGPNLNILNLRSNHFSGNIPLQICHSSSLTILDLAYNRISGSIPSCLSNMKAMTFNNASNDQFLDPLITLPDTTPFPVVEDLLLLMKGQELNYRENLKLVRVIDLSSNNVCGTIPPEIFRLVGLHSLNLSHNQLMGNIPNEIGNMKHLESLDLSTNQLSGEIPQSLSQLTFLSVLNLSFNNFNGRIPLGTQLQSFDALSYIGNPQLCGAPLPKNCTHEDDSKPIGEDDDKNESEFVRSFYLGMGVGFATAFWGVCGAIFFNRGIRHAFFRLFDEMKDRIYVMVVLKMNRLH
ncbi:receptor-like protein EIX2 [Senna tora]|uniref:Receptor-like protein EIX2 n=1 Tax=Senna tora TaxID=362788 RepID=A0A834WN29_9FABA|nr:receptor-like protein EIX2 [Senna tora]